MGIGPAIVDEAVEAPLVEWRRKVTDALTIVGALSYLPGVVLWLAGHGPPVPLAVTALAFGTYLAVAAAAVLRRLDQRARVWAVLGPAYLLSLLASISFPQGPFLRSLPISLSILAFVLIGMRAGRAATLLSAAIFLGPLLRTVPGVTRYLAVDSTPAPASTALLITQGFALGAALVALMILLERFYVFLLQSLAAEHRAVDSLAREMRERHRLQREIARIGDEERRRLGQDVHDGVCQQITGALLRCQALERGLRRGGALSAADITALSDLLEEAIDEAHAVAQGLHPLGRDPGALASALRTVADRARKTAGVYYEFVTSGDVSVTDPAAAHNLYRIAQEAVSNAVRHARADRILVELHGSEDELVLRVQDDGVGLPSEFPADGLGLRTMSYRAQVMEGTLFVEPAAVRGVRVTCRVPRGGIGRSEDRLGESEKEAKMEPDQSTFPAISVLLVDDHPAVREGLALLLAPEGITVCCEAGERAEALAFVTEECPDLALVDLSLADEDGLELVKDLHARAMPTLVYSMHEDVHHVGAAFAAGAMGYVTKRAAHRVLLEAIREVAAGRRFVCPSAALALAMGAADPSAGSDIRELSEHESHVYRFVGQGDGTLEIAAVMHISTRTVESYYARIIEKLGLDGMQNLRRHAIAHIHDRTP